MSLKLHNAMWPGVVGKGEPDTEAAIDLDQMIELTTAAEVNGERFDGIDLFLFQTHFDVEASDDQIKQLADKIAAAGLSIGSLVAPVWPGTVGASAMGSDEDRRKFLDAIKVACRAAEIFNEHGARSYGCIRIDSAASPVEWAKDPVANTKRIAETFQQAADIAADYGERLAAEGEICWAGMHSWKHMLDLLETVDRPGVVGFQADLAHTYLYLLGVNAPEHALLKDGYSDEEFWQAYETMTMRWARGRSIFTSLNPTVPFSAAVAMTKPVATAPLMPTTENSTSYVAHDNGCWTKISKSATTSNTFVGTDACSPMRR